MILKYLPDDPYIGETLQHMALFAVESPLGNTKIALGNVTLSCTANTLQTQSVTFGNAFKKGTNPVLFLFANPSNTSSKNTASYASLTNSGFTCQCYSDTTQSVTISYLAIGQVGGV